MPETKTLDGGRQHVPVGTDMADVEEAKRIYQQARAENRRILNNEGKPISSFREALEGFVIDEIELKEGEFTAQFIDKTGDRRLIWNANDPEQVAEAFALFKEYMDKGWKPYAITKDDRKGHKIHSFDPTTEEILFEDKSTKEKLAGFGKKFSDESFSEKPLRMKLKGFSDKFREIKVLPKKYPG